MPSKEWIEKNCVVKGEFKEHLDELPGKFTLIFELKDNIAIAKKELVGEVDTIGVRMPNNWFAEFLSRHELVFVTTSVNISGQEPIKKVEDLEKEISEKVDYVIDDGPLEGSPSTLVNLSKEEVKFISR